MDTKKLQENHNIFMKISAQNAALRYKKLKGYGFISDEFGITGLIIRINDKINRLKTLLKWEGDWESKENRNRMSDTLADISNYCIMAQQLIEEENEE